ncbi:MAG: hypothetical protein LBG23_01900 [Endomicrobium sp.]|jgi:hypothetical protein|nr:hypothetical protein [Endomicrobium sp.]
MFYSKKYLFFIVAALIVISLYSFIDNFFELVEIHFNFILGFFTFYFAILFSCFLVSLIVFMLFKYVYKLTLFILKKKNKDLNLKVWWYCFTYFTYIVIFIIFLKVTQY